MHHFVRHDDLVAYLKSDPDVAERVKAHRAIKRRKGSQLDLIAA
ncbi:hypothetical protein [Paraburkholderia aromaticivorans]|nr:hypothetical protein [Paraburkholderia aromaticivorans]